MATVTFPEIDTANNAYTLLDGNITDSATSITVDSAAALGFTDTTTDAYITIISAANYRTNPVTSQTGETLEICQVTAVSGNTLTVTRGVDGTAGTAFSDNDIVELRITAAMIQRIYDALTDGNDTIAPNVVTVQNGAVGAPGYSFTDEADTGIYRIGTDNIGVSTGGTKAIEFTSAQDTVCSGEVNPVSERGHDLGTDALPWKDAHAEKMFLFPSNAGSQPTRWMSLTGNVSGTASSNYLDVNVHNGTPSSTDLVVRYRGSKRADYSGQLQTVGFQGNTGKVHTGDGTTTIDWGADGNVQTFTFGAFNETFTFTDPDNYGYCMLSVTQDGVGSRTATWPAAVKWPGGTAPTLSTGAGAVDLIVFMFDGTSYHGFSYLNYS